MWIKKHNELYINQSDTYLEFCVNKKGKKEWMIYDGDNTAIKFPILDILINPIFNPNPTALTMLTAIVDIPAYSIVTLDGRVANSDDITTRFSVCGIAPLAITRDAQGEYRTLGELANPNWSFTSGLPVFLNQNTLSHTAPTKGYIQQIGIAKDTNTLLINLKESIKLYNQ